MRNPLDHNEVIIGTDLGIWATTNFNDDNPNWVRTNNGMSDVKVTDLELRDDNVVFASTYGRGIFSGEFTGDNSAIEEENVVKVQVYPNPASEVVNIKLPENMNATAYVYDINGREVLKQKIENADIINFDVSKLRKGYYIVSLKNSETSYSAKFIVK